VGLAGRLAAGGAEILASRVAWLTARMLVLDRHETQPPEAVAFRRRAGVTGEALAAFAADPPFNFADCVAPIPPGFRALHEGCRLEAAGRVWHVRLGEGHAPEHATLWSEDGLVLAGDQILPHISPNIGVWPTEPGADPLGGFLESCARLLNVAAAGDPLVLPGHGTPFTGAAFRLRQLMDNHLSALDRIEAAIAGRAMTAVELFPVIFRRGIGAGETGLAIAEAVAHLNRLGAQGRAEAVEDAAGALRWRSARAG
jgi:glyoxylase-like metal-dependent hydrolase (beta-lactamase superfamily II)